MRRRLLLILMVLNTLNAITQSYYNAGVAGNNSTQGLARIEKDVVSKSPTICFIAFGMNDAVNDNNYTTLETFESNYDAIITKCKSINATPVLITVHYVDEAKLYQRHPDNLESFYMSRGGANAIIDTYNERIRSISRKHSIPLLDWNTKAKLLSDQSIVLLSDGVHFNPIGLNHMGFFISEWLKTNSTKESVIVAFGDSITKQDWITLAILNIKNCLCGEPK